MPLKPDQRAAEADALLQELREQLGERWVEDLLFDPRDPPFAEYHTTAWVELERKLLVARRSPVGWTGFYLTPRGWLVSMMGSESGPATDGARDRIYQVVTVLKERCQRNEIDPVRVPLEAISVESHVPSGWIRNAIVSRMVLYVVKDKHIDAWCEESCSGVIVVIGPGFGQPKSPR
jgi:hypothetical protein